MLKKEKIHPQILASLKKADHYLGDCLIYPNSIGDVPFLEDLSEDAFDKCVVKLKKSFNIDDVTPKEYIGIKSKMGEIIKEIELLEKDNDNELEDLAVNILRRFFRLPKDVKVHIRIGEQDEVKIYGHDILNASSLSKKSGRFEGDKHKDSSDKIINALICGGGNHIMSLYAQNIDKLDKIDYKLDNLYSKFVSFNDFNTWVTPDDVWIEQYEKKATYKIYDTFGSISITVNAPNFLIALNEGANAILSIIFSEKFDKDNVEYDNIWNVRIGNILWKELYDVIPDKKYISYILDDFRKLEPKRFNALFKKLLESPLEVKKSLGVACADYEKEGY